MDSAVIQLSEQIATAYEAGSVLKIEGGGSKGFLGNPVKLSPQQSISCNEHTGIIDYRKDELMLRVKAGTPLADIDTLLAENGQHLPFEPPQFSGNATIGGVIASGLSGPARAYQGSVRDYVLGLSFIDGRGIVYEMGGQVMKNVAGYDVSRLMVGSLGEMGLILDVSLKVLPVDEVSATFVWSDSAINAVADFQRLQASGLPLSASAWVEGCAYVRVGGAKPGVAHAAEILAETIAAKKIEDGEGEHFWQSLKNHQLSVFEGDGALWRMSTLPGSSALLSRSQAIEWGGGIRWLKAPVTDPRVETDPQTITLFNRMQDETLVDNSTPYQYLSGTILEINRKLKQQFDPGSILNPGRLLPS